MFPAIWPVLLVACSICVHINVASRLDPCEDRRLAATPICDRSLPLDERADGFIQLLSLQEKVLQMGNTAPEIARVGLPAYQWWNEALHGVLYNCIDGRCPTSYPCPLALAATFNMDLVETVAEQIASEARAIHTSSGGQYGLQVWAPNINIYKDPRWGRGQETPGECVYLTSQYAIRYVRGMQGANDGIPNPKLFATVKHFAVYNSETQRESFDAFVSDRDLYQTYLPAFRTSVIDGNVGSIMCSYNSVNGIPSCSNDFLLKTNLRDAWKFDGFVVSDCDAIGDISRSHRFVNTSAEGAAAALKSGVDLDCGDSYRHLEDAVNLGLIPERLVDQSLKRLFIARLRLGLFDPANTQAYNRIPLDVVSSTEHRRTALQAARESLVLLKNQRSFLPLASDNISSLLITGPHSITNSSLCSNYIGQLPKVVSIGTAIETALPKADVTIQEGCGITDLNLSNAVSAIEKAKSSQYTIVALGLDQSQETETRDRQHIALPGYQLDFLKELAKASSNIVVVVIGGGSVDLTWAKTSPAVKAIIYGFYPGEESGTAVSDLILGKFSPSGCLPITIYDSNYSNQVDKTSMEMALQPGKTYRFFNGTSVFPFGFGLSYSNFSLKWVSSPSNGSFKISVVNSGSFLSDFVVKAFFEMEDPNCPKRQLFGFQKLKDVEPGQERTAEFEYNARLTYCVDKDGKTVNPRGAVTIAVENLLAKVNFSQMERNSTRTSVRSNRKFLFPESTILE